MTKTDKPSIPSFLSKARAINRRRFLITTSVAAGGAAVWWWKRGEDPSDVADLSYEGEIEDLWDREPVAVPEGFRVAIIGAGIAGSASAWFVRKALGPSVELIVYEKNDHAGGRVRSMELAGGRIELGATLLHSSNRHLLDLAESTGLEPVPPHNRDSEDSSLAIWSGDDFAFETAHYGWLTMLRTLRRYGRAPMRAQSMTEDFVESWKRIYTFQAEGRAFQAPESLFRALGLYDFATTESARLFPEMGLSSRFMDEFVTGISRVNYNQDASLNAFANAISLTGAGFADGRLVSIKGGNVQMCRKAIEHAGADLRKGAPVTAVAREDTQDGQPAYRVIRADGLSEAYDTVIIACPLELADLEFPDVALAPGADVRREYRVTHATFIAGELDPAYFGRSGGALLPDTILTMENPDIPFSSIGSVGYSPDLERPIYKVFSREEPDEELLSRLFRSRAATEHIRWEAYPILTPREAWPPFELAPRLYYANAMETAVSTMETQAVAARNMAALLREPFAA